jgi:hypothetical protein
VSGGAECGASLQVTLDLLPGPCPRLIGILREFPMGASLAQQIPALVKGCLKIPQPLGAVAHLTWVLLHLAAQLMLSINHLADAREDV